VSRGDLQRLPQQLPGGGAVAGLHGDLAEAHQRSGCSRRERTRGLECLARAGDVAGAATRRTERFVEVDSSSEDQRRIWSSATYFNPADIICSLRSVWGDPFDLPAHQDSASWMVVARSRNGRTIRSLERPGLWNGGMAEWNTVFLEVPKATCRPVKTVVDLLDLPDLVCS
jgi:hypothetical protein